MSAFPKYDRYKDSGVEWLGEIPEHWEAVPNRALLTEQREKVGKKAADYTLLSLTLNGVIPRDMENPQGKFPAEFDTYTIVDPDDLVFCLFDIDETPRAIGHSEHHGMITGAYNVYEPTKLINPRYIYYYYLFLDADKRLKPLYSGLRKTIQRGVFASAKSPLPPKPEQDRIVTFLDRKTAEIDALIAKKQRQIELLDEQKAILINRAVTRGLNPNAKLKPSGIEWIGEIPEGWKTPRLSYVASLNSGGTPERENPRFWANGSIPWLKTGEIRNNIITGAEEAITPSGVRHSAAKVSPPNTLLMAMYGQGVTRGRVALLSIEATYNQACLAIWSGDSILQTYLFWFFQAGYTFLRDDGNETSQMNLNADTVGRMRVLIPSSEEQKAIAAACEDICKLAATVRTTVETEIESLKTLRSTLIAHAVTGRINVEA